MSGCEIKQIRDQLKNSERYKSESVDLRSEVKELRAELEHKEQRKLLRDIGFADVNEHMDPQGNPQYPNIYPQIYNPSNAPPPAAMAYPAPGAQQYPAPSAQPFPAGAPGFSYPGYPGQPAMQYPGAQPSAPPVVPSYYPSVAAQPRPGVEWVPSTPSTAASLSDRAVIGGYEGYDHSPLWVIRAHHEGDIIPGKLAIRHNAAYVAWGGKEKSVANIEVCCARPETIRWVESSYGNVPAGAVPAGRTKDGETLYIGRAKREGSLTPGKVHPSHKVMYMSYGGEEVPHQTYEVLCAI